MHIVLVEPSRTVAKIVGALLQEARHEVFPFADGREALEFLKSNATIDALVTSSEPLSISGAELCRAARNIANDQRPLYVLLMSSTDDQQRLVTALDLGADDFVHKPPRREEFFARLRVAERSLRERRELVLLANTDPLTGVANRRAFFRTAGDITRRTNLVGAIMFDIDHFKRINDRLGHDAGDQVLQAVAALAEAAPGIIGRLGGEEFAIILEGIDIAAGFLVADALRINISNHRFKTEDGIASLTCSFGVSERLADEPFDELLRRTDVALFEAKTAGRNRVCVGKTDRADRPPPGSVVRGSPRDLDQVCKSDSPRLERPQQGNAPEPRPGARLSLVV